MDERQDGGNLMIRSVAVVNNATLLFSFRFVRKSL